MRTNKITYLLHSEQVSQHTKKITHLTVKCMNLPSQFHFSLTKGARTPFWIILAHLEHLVIIAYLVSKLHP